MVMKRFACLALALAAVMVVGIGTAAAQQAAHNVHPFTVQGFVGSYGPGANELDDDVVWGGSFGWRLTDAFLFEAGLSTVSLSGNFDEGRSHVNFDGDFWFFDGGIEWTWFPRSNISPTLVGGMGWTFVNLDASQEGPRVDINASDLQDDSYTLYGGVGLKVRFGADSPFYINGRWFYRWFDQRSSDSSDRELTVAFGWDF